MTCPFQAIRAYKSWPSLCRWSFAIPRHWSATFWSTMLRWSKTISTASSYNPARLKVWAAWVYFSAFRYAWAAWATCEPERYHSAAKLKYFIRFSGDEEMPAQTTNDSAARRQGSNVDALWPYWRMSRCALCRNIYAYATNRSNGSAARSKHWTAWTSARFQWLCVCTKKKTTDMLEAVGLEKRISLSCPLFWCALDS